MKNYEDIDAQDIDMTVDTLAAWILAHQTGYGAAERCRSVAIAIAEMGGTQVLITLLQGPLIPKIAAAIASVLVDYSIYHDFEELAQLQKEFHAASEVLAGAIGDFEEHILRLTEREFREDEAMH